MALPALLLILLWPSMPGSVPTLRNHTCRLGEDIAVEIIEAAGDLPRNFDVRLIILPHGNDLSPRQQDIGRLQHRIAQQPKGDGFLLHMGRCAPSP
ncbi:MAG: hypothetical protein KatS3mg057_1853 [Herpetosiphonaceae bacterium]|nr:MAG: hypothetical protein KatS3mg057_1853 [Herpetosiphonaceae bacterium]